MSKEKGFLFEFKKFITRGNVIDLAVGVIIGGAFQKIVNSLVNDIVMPLISLITGGIDFNNWFFVLGEGDFATIADAKAAGVATFNYGSFISAVLDFLIMAFVIFVIIRAINKISDKLKKPEEKVEKASATKICPYCKSKIDINAVKCPHCTADIKE